MWIYKLAQLTAIIYINMYMYGCVQSFFVVLQSSDLLSSNLLLGQSTEHNFSKKPWLGFSKIAGKIGVSKKKRGNQNYLQLLTNLLACFKSPVCLLLICSYTYVYAYTEVCSFYEITVANTAGVQKLTQKNG